MEDSPELPLFQQQAKGPRHLTVTELTARVRGLLEPSLTDVWVQGEVSNLRPAASGHLYFSLKDKGASLSVAFFGWGSRKRFELRDGLEVLCHGKVSVYPPRGSYQLVADRIEPLGAGALQAALEQLKAKLAGEGLFDSARKRAIPKYPSRICVITSPSGAALRDVLNVLGRRAPHVRVVVVPSLVQGEGAADQLVRGLELANLWELGEVVLLTRGGGSLEDLWCFNNEALVRAIVASKLPVVSAVGHEIDTTLSDFAADVRAATPSAGAEILTNHWFESGRRVVELAQRLEQLARRGVKDRSAILQHVVARLIDPRDRLRDQIQRCDELSLRLERAIGVRLDSRRSMLAQWVAKLDALSPLKVLERGYAIVRASAEGEASGKVIRSASQVDSGLRMAVTFYDGERQVQAV